MLICLWKATCLSCWPLFKEYWITNFSPACKICSIFYKKKKKHFAPWILGPFVLLSLTLSILIDLWNIMLAWFCVSMYSPSSKFCDINVFSTILERFVDAFIYLLSCLLFLVVTFSPWSLFPHFCYVYFHFASIYAESFALSHHKI